MDCSLSRIPLTTRAFPRNQTITGCHLSAVLIKFVIIALSVINYIVSTKKDHFLRLSDLKYYLVGPTHSPPSFKSLDDKSKSVTIHDDDCRHERQRQHGWKFYGSFPGHLGPNPSPSTVLLSAVAEKALRLVHGEGCKKATFVQ